MKNNNTTMKKFNEFYGYEEEMGTPEVSSNPDMGKIMNMLGEIQNIPGYEDNSSMEPAFQEMKAILDKYLVDSTFK